MVDGPLVSVIVTTYNSATFVSETLESVKDQAYENIELIISDDASTDNTIKICKEWLAGNAGRFVRSEIITVPKNTGVSANCNRSTYASRADWIKFIAGDDILLPNCIEDNIKFVAENPDVCILFSQVLIYRDTFENSNFVRLLPQAFPFNIMNPSFTADDQFKLLLISDRINFTPSYFFYKKAVISVGGYDERNRIVEDYPMWLKLTQAGYKLHFMKKKTVGYRQHQQATNNIGDEKLFKPAFLKIHSFRKREVYPYLPWDIVWAENYTMAVAWIFDSVHLNSNLSVLRWIYYTWITYLNPFMYVMYFKKHVLGLKHSNFFYRN